MTLFVIPSLYYTLVLRKKDTKVKKNKKEKKNIDEETDELLES
jgi:hypothetical protein